MTKSGHADNPATFAPCVKSMTADFISQNSQCSPRGGGGGLPYIFVRQMLLRKSSMKNTE